MNNVKKMENMRLKLKTFMRYDKKEFGNYLKGCYRRNVMSDLVLR